MIPDDTWRLDPTLGIKPLDFGLDGLTGSVDSSGRLIALNVYHPRYGYVTLTTADPFPEAERYHPAAVRAYRRSLVALDGFGPRFEQLIIRREAFLIEHAIPVIRLFFEDGSAAEGITFASEQGAVQIWRCPFIPRWVGRLSLQRCAYTQLTEGGPVEMPPVQSVAVMAQGMLALENPALRWAVAIAGFGAEAGAWGQITPGPVDIDLPGTVGETVLCYSLGPTVEIAGNRALELAAQNPGELLHREIERWRDVVGDTDRLAARGRVYSLMLAVPVGETRCLLTDHMLLPLSWNRDAYYAARVLLDHQPEIVRQHLLWMFETAERSAHMWGRCYLANGQIKDRAFQLDQQIFPLLELAEYVLATGERALWDRLRPQVQTVLDELQRRRSQADWLFPTDETPADDPLVLPYHFSSHILLWRALRRLYEVEPRQDWLILANNVRAAALRHFDTGQVFAYAVDGGGQFRLYHDANDLPLALASLWGFIEATDPRWVATVTFAFSEENRGGCYAGHLGSVHTPAPWPLGDIQEVLIARALDDHDRAQQALARLAWAAQWDGALPEAYDPVSGEVVSRHWFDWPNAALTCLVTNSF